MTCLHKMKLENLDADAHNARYQMRKIWNAMIGRCTNSNFSNYKNYGGRGISVCRSWLEFDNFYRDMGDRPKGLTLERINNNKGYSLDNCKWATKAEQANNTRNLKFFLALGPKGQIEVSKHQTRFANKWSLNEGNISHCLCGRQRIHKGWIFEFLTT